MHTVPDADAEPDACGHGHARTYSSCLPEQALEPAQWSGGERLMPHKFQAEQVEAAEAAYPVR